MDSHSFACLLTAGISSCLTLLVTLLLLRKFNVAIDGARRVVMRVETQLGHIAAGQRLSTVLRLEGKAVEVSGRFEPKKEALLASVLDAFRSVEHPVASTRAYCITKTGGLKVFLDPRTANKVDDALGRLLVNGDHEGAESFLRTVVDQL